MFLTCTNIFHRRSLEVLLQMIAYIRLNGKNNSNKNEVYVTSILTELL